MYANYAIGKRLLVFCLLWLCASTALGFFGSPWINHYNARGDLVAQMDHRGEVMYQAAYDEVRQRGDGAIEGCARRVENAGALWAQTKQAFGESGDTVLGGDATDTRTQTEGSTVDRQRSNTKDRDPTGLINEGMRYRTDHLFLTRDPLMFVDGPNMYTYVVQNPWTKFDPTGLSSVFVSSGMNTTPISTLDPDADLIDAASEAIMIVDVQVTVLSAIFTGGLAPALKELGQESFSRATGLPAELSDLPKMLKRGKGKSATKVESVDATSQKSAPKSKAEANAKSSQAEQAGQQNLKNKHSSQPTLAESSAGGAQLDYLEQQYSQTLTKQTKLPKHTTHSLHQKINREVKTADELDALKNPLQTTPVKTDSLGRESQRVVGEKATIAVNPSTNKIVSVNPTSSKRAKKLKKKKQEDSSQ